MNTISHRVYQTGEGERESDRPRTSENQATSHSASKERKVRVSVPPKALDKSKNSRTEVILWWIGSPNTSERNRNIANRTSPVGTSARPAQVTRLAASTREIRQTAWGGKSLGDLKALQKIIAPQDWPHIFAPGEPEFSMGYAIILKKLLRSPTESSSPWSLWFWRALTNGQRFGLFITKSYVKYWNGPCSLGGVLWFHQTGFFPFFPFLQNQPAKTAKLVPCPYSQTARQ